MCGYKDIGGTAFWRMFMSMSMFSYELASMKRLLLVNNISLC
jgi:hypothetical protein